MIFEPLTIKEKKLPNRFFAQAMEGNDGENGGKPSERTVNRYTELAKGEWGAVQAEAVSVTETSLARINGMILNRKNLDSFKNLIEAFKKNNTEGSFFVQLTHSGERSGPFSERVTITPEEAKNHFDSSTSENCRYLSTDEIEKIKEHFVEAVLLAEEAGFDGVDLKLCHGYFGAEMLRPSNIRNDKWGGSFENRTRFFRETAEEIKSRLKTKSFILGSRISMYEGIRGGCGCAGPDEIVEDISQMLDLVRLMGKLKMDFVNISAGIPAQTGAITRPVENSKYLAYHHFRYAKIVKELVEKENLSMAVIGSAYSTYKENSLELMKEMLSKNYVDACGFGRQIFADPLTPKKLKNGEGVNWCILCSGCSKLMKAQMNDGCIIYNPYYKELNKTCKITK